MDLRSGVAFWPLRNGLLQAYPPLDRDETADVVVIGAGITGALVAERLVAAGANVVVLDKRDVASGSTAATTGLLLYETDTSLAQLADSVGEADAVRAWRLGRDAIDGIERLCADMDHTARDSTAIGDACGFARRPSLYLASSRRDAKALAREQTLRAAHGFDAEWLSERDVHARYGIDAPGAIYSRGAAEIDAYRFTHRVLRRVVSGGARVYDRTDVVTIHVHDDSVTLDTSRGPRIEARRIVWAAGYEAVEETQARVGRRHSTWALVSEPIDDFGAWSDRALIWETARPYLYVRSTDEGRVMLGGEDEPFSTRHTSMRRMSRKTRTLVARFGRLFPELAIEPACSWAGVFVSTKDGLPYIGATPEHPHAWLALGYGGNGITFSLVAADLIRDAWRGAPNADARIFAFDR
jgi:glycine/D-amino acid oxidase-like deaminating enzyme